MNKRSRSFNTRSGGSGKKSASTDRKFSKVQIRNGLLVVVALVIIGALLASNSAQVYAGVSTADDNTVTIENTGNLDSRITSYSLSCADGVSGDAYPYWIDSTLSNVYVPVTIPAMESLTLSVEKTSGHSPDGRSVFTVFDDFEGGSEQWIEYDPASKISIDRENGYIQYQYATADEGGYVYMDKGSDIGEFIYEWDSYIVNQQSASSVMFCGVSDTLAAYPYSGMWNDGMYSGYYQSSSNVESFINKIVTDGSTGHVDVVYNWNVGTHYYGRMVRTDTTGEFYIYSDPERTNLIASNSASATGLSGLRYVYSAFAWFDGVDGRYDTGRLYEVILRQYVDNEPTVTVQDMGTYYQVIIQNNEASALTDYQVSIPADDLVISSTTDSLSIGAMGVASFEEPGIVVDGNRIYYDDVLETTLKYSDGSAYIGASDVSSSMVGTLPVIESATSQVLKIDEGLTYSFTYQPVDLVVQSSDIPTAGVDYSITTVLQAVDGSAVDQAG